MSGFISLCRPESGAVRSKHLVSQNDIAVLVKTEFKFGVCDDNAFAQSVFRAFFVQGDGVIAELLRIFAAFAGEVFLQMIDTLLEGNVFVMIADLRLGGRCVDGLRQLVGLFQSFRKADAADRAVLLITCPAASCNISAHDTFNGKHVQLAAHHGFAVELLLLEEFRHIFHIYRNHMVGNDVFRHIEPEF